MIGGGSSSSSASQGSAAGNSAGNSLSGNEARLRAAATAASLYEKSFVYPSASSLTWYDAAYFWRRRYLKYLSFCLLNQSIIWGLTWWLVCKCRIPPSPIQFHGLSSNPKSAGHHQNSMGQSHQNLVISNDLTNTSIPFHLPGAHMSSGDNASLLETQKAFLQHQIEVRFWFIYMSMYD